MKLEIITNYYTSYKLIIFPFLVAVAGIFTIYLVIYPQISGYLKGIDEISRMQDRVVRLSTKAASLETLDTSGLTGKLDTALDALPADRDLANLLGAIQNLASENGVVLVAVALGQVVSDKQAKFNPFTVRLEVGGSKDAFKNFINNIEKAPRVMRVSSLELSPAKASDSASASTVIEVYFAPTPKEIGAVDAPLPTISAQEEETLAKLVRETPVQVTQPTTETPAVSVPKGKANPFQ